MEECSCRETNSPSLDTKPSRSLWNQNFHCDINHELHDSRNTTKFLFATAGVQVSYSYMFRPFQWPSSGKYHCTEPSYKNSSNIANVPPPPPPTHTHIFHSTYKFFFSLTDWKDTTREPDIHQPLDRHLRFQHKTGPTQSPTTGKEAEYL
jgi:hypothetical protein